MESIMHKVFGSRATTRQGLRQAVIAQLYATRSNPYTGSNNPQEKQVQVLNDLASSFSRFAGNQQTAFDNGASRSATVIDSSGMERQIAITVAERDRSEEHTSELQSQSNLVCR